MMFLPSEISRLVLGYLMQLSCNQASEAFLCECKHLEEYAQSLEDDYEYPLTIGGKSLINILSEYSQLKKTAKCPASSLTSLQSFSKTPATLQPPQSSSSIKRCLDIGKIRNRRSGNNFNLDESYCASEISTVQQNQPTSQVDLTNLKLDVRNSLPLVSQGPKQIAVSQNVQTLVEREALGVIERGYVTGEPNSTPLCASSNFNKNSNPAVFNVSNDYSSLPNENKMQYNSTLSKQTLTSTMNSDHNFIHPNVNSNVGFDQLSSRCVKSSGIYQACSTSQIVQVSSPSSSHINENEVMDIQDINPTIHHTHVSKDTSINQVTPHISKSSNIPNQTNSRYMQVPSPLCSTTIIPQINSVNSVFNQHLQKPFYSPKNLPYGTSGPNSCPPNLSTLNSPVNSVHNSDITQSDASHRDIGIENCANTPEAKTPEMTTQPTIPHRHHFHNESSNSRLSMLEGAQINSMSTPTKSVSASRNDSPRRKNVTPRRRLVPTTPQSKEKLCEDLSSFFIMPSTFEPEDTEENLNDFSNWFEHILNAQPLHEKIAANINKAVCLEGVSEVQPSNESDCGKVPLEIHQLVQQHETISNQVIDDIINKTQADPEFEAILSSKFGDKMETTPKDIADNPSNSRHPVPEANAENTPVASSMCIPDNSLKTLSKDDMATVFSCHSTPEETGSLVVNSVTECDSICDHPSLSTHNTTLETPLKNNTLTLFSYEPTPNETGVEVKKSVTLSCDNNSALQSASNNSPVTSEVESICKDMNISGANSKNDDSANKIACPIPTSQEQEPQLQISVPSSSWTSKPKPSTKVKQNVKKPNKRQCLPNSTNIISQAKPLDLKPQPTTSGASNLMTVCNLQQVNLQDNTVIYVPLSNLSYPEQVVISCDKPNEKNPAINLQAGPGNYCKILPKRHKRSPDLKNLLSSVFTNFNRTKRRKVGSQSHVRHLKFSNENIRLTSSSSTTADPMQHNGKASSSIIKCDTSISCPEEVALTKQLSSTTDGEQKKQKSESTTSVSDATCLDLSAKTLSCTTDNSANNPLHSSNVKITASKSASKSSVTEKNIKKPRKKNLNVQNNVKAGKKKNSTILKSDSSNKDSFRNVSELVCTKEKSSLCGESQQSFCEPNSKSKLKLPYDELSSIINAVKKFDNKDIKGVSEAEKPNLSDNDLNKHLPLRKRSNSFNSSINVEESSKLDSVIYYSSEKSITDNEKLRASSLKSKKPNPTSGKDIVTSQKCKQPRKVGDKKSEGKFAPNEVKLNDKNPSNVSVTNQNFPLELDYPCENNKTDTSSLVQSNFPISNNNQKIYTVLKDCSLLTEEAMKSDIEIQNSPQYKKGVWEHALNSKKTSLEILNSVEGIVPDVCNQSEETLVLKKNDSHQVKSVDYLKLQSTNKSKESAIAEPQSRKKQILAWEKLNSPLASQEELSYQKFRNLVLTNSITNDIHKSSLSSTIPSNQKKITRPIAVKRKNNSTEDEALSNKLSKLYDVDAFLNKIHG
ncbi:Protein NPAT [Nymphon striatum]|nr:Protein NPAT [Nymphon striatum]